ncbi:MAG: YqgE/AlgH family protein [Bacteroidia bacterium]
MSNAGKILVAHPLLNDSFFTRSVIFITQDTEEGALGFVTNFKTQFLLRDVRPQMTKGNWPIYEGGPVAKNQLFYLHKLGDKITNSVHVCDDIYFGGDFDEVIYLIEHNEITKSQLRFYAGYSGWAPEQLQNEIERNSWFVEDFKNSDLFDENYFEAWGRALSRKKESLRLFSDISFGPSLN